MTSNTRAAQGILSDLMNRTIDAGEFSDVSTFKIDRNAVQICPHHTVCRKVESFTSECIEEGIL
jgi:hypothetical protein